MKLRTVRAIVAVVTVGFLGGCVTVGATRSPDVNLSQYRTYSWLAPTSEQPKQLAFARSPAGQVVHDRIASDLAAKGLQQTTTNPDFFVAYNRKLEEKAEYDDWGYGGFFGGPWVRPMRVDEYTQGTLFIDFIDAKTKQVIWSGTATSIVDNPDAPNTKRLASAVDKVMKRYPTM